MSNGLEKIRIFQNSFSLHGGLKNILYLMFKVYRRDGLLGFYLKIKKKLRTEPIDFNYKESDLFHPIVRPYYLSDHPIKEFVLPVGQRIAVHLHLYDPDLVREFTQRLKNIPQSFDLFISVPEETDLLLIQNIFKNELMNLNQLTVETVPNQGRELASLIIQFGERLCQYDIIAHIHTIESPHNKQLDHWFQTAMDILIGSAASSGRHTVEQILDLLSEKADIIVPENSLYNIKEPSGWAGNYDLAKFILEKYTKISIEDFKKVDFSEGSMFWAKTNCLKEFLTLPLKFSDFPNEPIAADGTLAHALERLLLIFASQGQKKCLRLIQNDSIQDFRFYEEQKDFSKSIIHKDIKILSYYLPQFHPIPENDLWHGPGFTEWTKVKAAQPLFKGHYQQHIPHPDIGYYFLDSVQVLHQQAEMMKKHGVFGQIFYHYWFSGKLILEKPAQMLLHNPEVDMPYCFCWANENWTRRWDGNEKEILLGQNYSAQDAKDFIQYLIPFFKDPRHIRIDDRPVLYIYRPTSIPNVTEYIRIWEAECFAAGLKKPYIVAVLTRGATDPDHFKMDAAVERVLHDWTDGGVPEIKQNLNAYEPLLGSVLSYNAVADFYKKKTDIKSFTYFRSLVPMWDNTARYAKDAIMLHESNPEKFQDWLEQTISYTKKTLPLDRQFIVINAWNEWAEGAHLEPDTRHGYGYLNAIGRALANKKYSEELNEDSILPNNIHIHIHFSDFILNQFSQDQNLKNRIIQILKASSVFKFCSISSNDEKLIPSLNQKVDELLVFTLEIHQASVFNSLVIEKMLRTAFLNQCDVLSNVYGTGQELVNICSNGSVNYSAAYGAPLILKQQHRSKFLKVRSDARSFLTRPSRTKEENMQVVTAIIRFHKNGDFAELNNAIYSLFSMTDCRVVPYVAAQDLNEDQKNKLLDLAAGFSKSHDFLIEIEFYQSKDGQTDLRSKMLNESLRKVKTKFATFLDYDDLLCSNAYGWLLNRIQLTKKAVSFGRVYSTTYNSKDQILIQRFKKYEFGFTYKDFVYNNHAPLHSFMIDLTKIDLSQIIYYDDQKYLEDYFLTLQLFTEDNCDWESLKYNFYIGDYIHSVDREHTLVFLNRRDRLKMNLNKEYLKCNQRIEEIHKKLVHRIL